MTPDEATIEGPGHCSDLSMSLAETQDVSVERNPCSLLVGNQEAQEVKAVSQSRAASTKVQRYLQDITSFLVCEKMKHNNKNQPCWQPDYDIFN